MSEPIELGGPNILPPHINSPNCWCVPTREPGSKVWRHNPPNPCADIPLADCDDVADP